MDQSLTLNLPRRRPARPWAAVLGSAIAMIVCNGPIILFTFGVLVGPITSDFGWRRGTLASAVLAAHVSGALMMPFVGGFLDRYGTRRLVSGSICVFAIVLAGMALLPPNPLAFIAAYAVLGLVGAGHSTLPYSRVIATWFRQRRGLALGVALAGVGVGSAAIPQAARLLVAAYGWRGAYVGLAGLVLVLALPAVLFLVDDRPKEDIETPAGVAGSRLDQAVATPQFWTLAVVLFLVAAAVNGMIAHIVPLLSDRGVSTKAATAALSASGLALIAGRVGSGFCLDRFFAPYVAAAFFLVPLIGLCLLGIGVGPALSLVAAVLLGMGIGAEVDIMSFLIARYFGLAHYGKIYGVLLAAFTLGSGSGPWLVAQPFDLFGSYNWSLAGCGAALALASFLVARLGPYRFE